jgi:hypothetical protein
MIIISITYSWLFREWQDVILTVINMQLKVMKFTKDRSSVNTLRILRYYAQHCTRARPFCPLAGLLPPGSKSNWSVKPTVRVVSFAVVQKTWWRCRQKIIGKKQQSQQMGVVTPFLKQIVCRLRLYINTAITTWTINPVPGGITGLPCSWGI